MTTSGTAIFDPDISEIIEESFERLGKESTTGYDIRTARRSLNLLSLEWANRQIHLWTIEAGTMPLLPNTATYTLPADTIDLLDVVIRTTLGTTNTDLAIGRLSLNEYSTIPSKGTTGRPVQFYIDRQRAAPTVTLWPVPPATTATAWPVLTAVVLNELRTATVAVGGFVVGQVIKSSSARTTGAVFDASEAANWTAAQDYTMAYWRMRRIQDVGTEGSLTMDVSIRAIPALIAGLTFYLAQKKAPERMTECKAIYDEQFDLMISEDRDRASFRVVPGIR